jgi:endonuclease YncB( thermonuclease family)
MPQSLPSCSLLSPHGRRPPIWRLATVIDGDTIVVSGERVRLQGIDVPELHQTCIAYGQERACGRNLGGVLREHLNGRTVE